MEKLLYARDGEELSRAITVKQRKFAQPAVVEQPPPDPQSSRSVRPSKVTGNLRIRHHLLPQIHAKDPAIGIPCNFMCLTSIIRCAKCQIFCIWHTKKISHEGLSRPDRSPIIRPNRPTPTRFRPESMVQSVGGGFPFSRTDTGGSSGGFASSKSEQPEPDRSCIKNPAKSYKIKPDPTRSRSDPARSSGI